MAEQEPCGFDSPVLIVMDNTEDNADTTGTGIKMSFPP